MLNLEANLNRFNFMRENPNDPFSFIPINDVGKRLANEVVVIQNASEGNYEIFYKKDLGYYKKIWIFEGKEVTTSP